MKLHAKSHNFVPQRTENPMTMAQFRIWGQFFVHFPPSLEQQITEGNTVVKDIYDFTTVFKKMSIKYLTFRI